ncbi:MAG: hypothetical protein PVH68_18130 [Armatimonadota bacterium]|jgi:L-seryl-tRNA(Ser) seleniumtransferase
MDFCQWLGVRRAINARGPVTRYGGALLAPEVVEAMAAASRVNVDMVELLRAVGERIARLLGVEAAAVTSGAAAGLVVSAAACMTGDDPEKISMLPSTWGLDREVLMFASQEISYANYINLSGAELAEIEPPEGLDDVISHDTAAFVYFAGLREDRCPPLQECAGICNSQGVPVIVDAARKMPTRENVRRLFSQGADLLIYSGGKAIGGPQPSGIICGREDLVRACFLNACPHSAVGRPMKVGREEAAGLLRALELFLERDYAADAQAWTAKLETVKRGLAGVPGLAVRLAERSPDGEPVPCICIRPDTRLGLPSAGVAASTLAAGDDSRPPVATWPVANELLVWATMLQDGDEHILAERLAEVFAGSRLREEA